MTRLLPVPSSMLGAFLSASLVCFALAASRPALAQAPTSQPTTATPIPPSITTPDSVETTLGTLKFRDGVPSVETAQKMYDQLDLQRGVEAFLNGLRGVSIYAARKGMRDAGLKDNDVLIFSGLMDSKSLFLTANADTVYFFSNIDLSKGPMVVETPPGHARAVRRSVVPLGDRLRHAGPRSRAGREVSPAAARL